MKNIFLVSISAQIIIIPIMAYTYKTISLTFPITSILTSALIGIIIIIGFILALISLISIKILEPFSFIYKLLINLLLIITQYTSQIPFSKIYVKTPYFVEIIFYYLIIFLSSYLYQKCGKEKIISKIKDNYKKIIAILLIFILIFNLFKIITPNNLKIYFIDVGQGDSCLVVTPRNTKILIDGGGTENYDIGENVLLPYLLNRRIDTIDYVICSHADLDHIRTE